MPLFVTHIGIVFSRYSIFVQLHHFYHKTHWGGQNILCLLLSKSWGTCPLKHGPSLVSYEEFKVAFRTDVQQLSFFTLA